MNEILRRIGTIGIVPVVSLPDATRARPLAQALVRGNLPVAEVTFRTAAAAEGIALMKQAEPEMLVGAGTVLTTAQVRAALDAGAEFIVAPGFDPQVVDYCLERAVPVMPGVMTASELTQAVLRNLPAVKFFPAEAMGGMKTLKALAGPFPDVLFMATGGVTAANVGSYLSWNRMLAIGGSWMVAKDLLAEERYDDVSALALQAVCIVAGLKDRSFLLRTA